MRNSHLYLTRKSAKVFLMLVLFALASLLVGCGGNKCELCLKTKGGDQVRYMHDDGPMMICVDCANDISTIFVCDMCLGRGNGIRHNVDADGRKMLICDRCYKNYYLKGDYGGALRDRMGAMRDQMEEYFSSGW